MDEKEKMIVLPAGDLNSKLTRLFDTMQERNVDTLVVSSLVNKLYLTGRVFIGYIVLTGADRSMHCYVRRPSTLGGPGVTFIHKVENIPGLMTEPVGRLALETDNSTYSHVVRLAKAFGKDEFANADDILSAVRAVKTPYEISQIEADSRKLSFIYSRIPLLYRPGMTDVELQVEIERVTRLEGGTGMFRVGGEDMEFNNGSVLVGGNADEPSPYDFAMGGRGIDPSLPVGANGTIIRPGNTVMVDTNGTFNAYMTDMTRTFILGESDEKTRRAHALSISILRRLEQEGRAGSHAADLYNTAVEMAKEAGFEDYFMGHRAKAGFVGHGVGIVINELPVIAPRSKAILEAGNVIALEPKLVLPGVGAVGVENTYVVTENGLRKLTDAPEELMTLVE